MKPLRGTQNRPGGSSDARTLFAYGADCSPKRLQFRASLHWMLAGLLGIAASAVAVAVPLQPAGAAQAAAQQPVVLDRVVAVVGDTAILASDVDEEMRFEALQPGKAPAGDNAPDRALDRLIDRTLIDEQRVLQAGLVDVSQSDVDKALADLQKGIPACVQYNCGSPAGWQAFLAAHHLTPEEVEQHIRERLSILKFIDLRFGATVRVSNAEVRDYYERTLLPELRGKKIAAPGLNAVSPKIREILRQQRISSMIDAWLVTLRSQQQVRVLDSAYSSGGSGQ